MRTEKKSNNIYITKKNRNKTKQKNEDVNINKHYAVKNQNLNMQHII